VDPSPDTVPGIQPSGALKRALSESDSEDNIDINDSNNDMDDNNDMYDNADNADTMDEGQDAAPQQLRPSQAQKQFRSQLPHTDLTLRPR